MTVQISFLGKSQLDTKTGYRTARYRFDDGSKIDTAFFGPALARKIGSERLIFLGTSGSMWDNLLEDQTTEDRLEEQRLALMDAVRQDSVTDDMLAPFAPLIGERIGCAVTLRVIAYGRTAGEQADILSTLAGAVGSEHETDVVLDVTHGLRHLPMIGLAAAYYLEHLQSVRVADIYYGALDLTRDGITPVLSLKGLLTVMDWVQALAAYDRDGYYDAIVPLLERAGVDANAVGHLRRAAFAERVFNHKMARTNLLPVRELIDQGLPGEAALFTAALGRRLAWANNAAHSARLAAIARERLQRGDHLRCAIAATVAFLVGMARPDERLSIYDTHEVIEADFRSGRRGNPDLRRDYERLKRLRNALAHGTPPKDNDSRRCLADDGRLRAALKQLIDRLLPERVLSS